MIEVKNEEEMALVDKVSMQLYPLEMVLENLQRLTTDAREQKGVTLGYHELNSMCGAVFSVIENIRRTIGEEAAL